MDALVCFFLLCTSPLWFMAAYWRERDRVRQAAEIRDWDFEDRNHA